jgi:hypothetical protein
VQTGLEKITPGMSQSQVIKISTTMNESQFVNFLFLGLKKGRRKFGNGFWTSEHQHTSM